MVWTGQSKLPTEVVFASAAQLAEWMSANNSRVASTVSQQIPRLGCNAWHAPPAGTWKLNVDAAFFDDTNQMGIGMVVCNELGNFVVAKSIVVQGWVEVDVGDAMGFYEALS